VEGEAPHDGGNSSRVQEQLTAETSEAPRERGTPDPSPFNAAGFAAILALCEPVNGTTRQKLDLIMDLFMRKEGHLQELLDSGGWDAMTCDQKYDVVYAWFFRGNSQTVGNGADGEAPHHGGGSSRAQEQLTAETSEGAPRERGTPDFAHRPCAGRCEEHDRNRATADLVWAQQGGSYWWACKPGRQCHPPDQRHGRRAPRK
jgi:hypothetical protein